MTDEPEELVHRERKRIGVVCALVALVLVVYVVSPPIVAWVFGLTSWNGLYVYDAPVFHVIYSPLISLSNRYDDVYEFYVWYFELFPLQNYEPGSGPGGFLAE